MNINKTYSDNDLTVQVEGRIDTITSQQLEESLNEDIKNIDSLTLDFEKLEYISSAGLRLLIATQKKLKSTDTPLTIINVNETLKEIFRMSGFDKLLTIQ
ncbi:STAS domain-containing protein [Methanosphaera sp. BMS]|uniref:STAS domain-containing protein n=1 Tax=Methanosphaera sp. BMS TaxID=1789762 RepID=UPI000DC1F26C|nr:STAS domain-containing protein [Methanosphaera sp. BMS]AWX33445.1 hypothetical protein AW729_10245 [Methanosphaera sp. BMS]